MNSTMELDGEIVETVELLEDVGAFSEANSSGAGTQLVTFEATETSHGMQQKYVPTTFTVIFPSEHGGMTLQNCANIELTGIETQDNEGTTTISLNATDEYLNQFLTTSFLPMGSELVSCVDSSYVVRCKISNEHEWLLWFEEFKRNSNTSWIARSSKPNSKYYTFSKDYVCRRSSYRKLDSSKIGCHCAATLAVRITNPGKSKKAREQHSKDGMWGLVRISNKHNHTVSTVEALAYLPPTSEIRAKFEEYFSAGMSVSEAVKHHLHYLEMIGEENIESTLANGALNPKVRTVRWWYEVWKQQNSVAQPEEKETIELEDLITIDADPEPEPQPTTSSIQLPQRKQRQSASRPVPKLKPEDLTSVLNKLVQLDDDFGPSPQGYARIMKTLKSIKTKAQWNSFLTRGSLSPSSSSSIIRIPAKKNAVNNALNRAKQMQKQKLKKRPRPVAS